MDMDVAVVPGQSISHFFSCIIQKSTYVLFNSTWIWVSKFCMPTKFNVFVFVCMNLWTFVRIFRQVAFKSLWEMPILEKNSLYKSIVIDSTNHVKIFHVTDVSNDALFNNSFKSWFPINNRTRIIALDTGFNFSDVYGK